MNMMSITTVLVLGVLPLISSVPVLEERSKREDALWVLTKASSSEESTLKDTAALIVTSTTEHSQFSCPDNGNAVFRDPVSCSLYYRCHQGHREVYKCLDGYLFKEETSRCEEASNVTCINKTIVLVEQTQVCQKQESGLYANYTTTCQNYYRCVGESLASTHSCGQGLSFSFSDQACMPSSEVDCIETHCAENGYFILPGTKCRAYYKCEDGLRMEYLCPRGQTFDKEKLSCMQSRNTCYEPLCTGRINGRYPDTSHNCQRSFLCTGGKLTAMFGCPPNQSYNGTTCTSSLSITCQPAKSSAIAILFPDSCSSLSDGAHRSTDSECRRFFICRGGKTVATLRCPEGLRFDGQHCTPSESTVCSVDCANQPNGYHIDPLSACREYTYCMDGINVDQRSCPEGTLYNGQMCVPAPIFDCPFKSHIASECTSLDNGLHTDYTSACKNYFYCSSGRVLFRSSCPDGHVWDGINCVKQKQFKCIGPEPWSGCLGLKTGLYQDQSAQSKCRNYHHCSNGQRTLLSCPDNQLFNGKICVSSSSFLCPSEDPDSCENKKDGYYQDSGSSCRSYFYCSNGLKITYLCFGTYVYNGKECVDPSIYKCPFTSQDCVALPNGYHHDKSTGCRKYFYCMDGDKITTLTCGGGKVFDGRRCVEQFIFQCPAEVNRCIGKADGLFADTNSDCRRYFKCLNQKQDTVSFCRDGKVFDGTECVVYKSSLTCSVSGVAQNLIPSGSDCGNSLNGFYQDHSSGCRQYYFCIDGMKTVLTCPSNQLFDGQVCVDSNSYSCPAVTLQLCKSNGTNKNECKN